MLVSGIQQNDSEYVCMQSCFSHIWLFEIPWTTTVARQAPLSMGFSRQGYWSGLPCPSPGHLPNPGIEPTFLMSPASAGGFFITSTTWEAICRVHNVKYHLSIKLLEKLKWRNLIQASEAVEQVLTLLQTCPDTDWIPCQFRSSASHEEF